MTTPPALGQRFVFVVLALIFLALLVSAGVRSTPGVLLLPLQDTFGWSRETVSLAAAIGIFLYGLVGPFAAALMQTLGIEGAKNNIKVNSIAPVATMSGPSSFLSEIRRDAAP